MKTRSGLTAADAIVAASPIEGLPDQRKAKHHRAASKKGQFHGSPRRVLPLREAKEECEESSGSPTVDVLEATAAAEARGEVRVISLYGRDFGRLAYDVEKASQVRTPQRYARLHAGRLTPPTTPEMP